MARSPSPTGSSASRRYRRDDYDRRRDDRRDRDRRQDKHGGRRSRSKSPPRHDRRYRDGSRDRRDRYSRRERSRDRDRDRRRSRDRDLRDDRRRSRDRHRDRRDDDRERERRRRDGSADSKRERKRPDSRHGRSSRADNGNKDSSKPSTAAITITDDKKTEDKKAERLARLEEWKKKQLAAALADKAKVQQATPESTRGLLDDMDKKIASPTASPTSPKTPASPKPYAGKFDPKAIVKKATTNAASAANRLGLDIDLPGAKASAPPKPLTNGISANQAPAACKTSSAPLKASGNLSGFGLSKSVAEQEKATKAGLDFEEEEDAKRKLEKLPTLALETANTDDAVLANEPEDEDDDVDMHEGTEEEAAAAARAAAEKREERIHAQNVAFQEGDVTMADADQQPEPIEEEAEEELDPLDAFMAGLDGPGSLAPTNQLKVKSKEAQQPVAIFGDEEDPMEAIDDENTDDIMAMAASKRKKKDIPKVDHAKVKYESFRKNFYHEPTELADMTEEELADLRLELEGIKVRGVDVPKPVMSWAQCGLGVQTLDVISKLNYEKPSAIQSQAIPAIMSGRDVIGVAKTGSGKTIAFLLPMFRHIKDQRPLENLEGPIALIMTPTRELATQIHRDCRPFLKALNLRALCAYGGAPIKDQIADLKRGAEIVVCTPGRMIDLLAANAGRVTNLKRVTYCVLDEADRMFDMGFEPQVMKIMANIRPDRQTVLFSATFPRQMEALARKALDKPVEIIVGGRSVVAPEITQIIEVRSEETKFVRLLELLGELYEDEEQSADYRTLIFVERQESADSLLKELMRKGYPCMSIHGGKDQIDRDSTIQDFKAGIVPIMIATSVAARGLDVKQLKLVVNYDTPNHLEDYVHRAGRTGRAGNTGTAVTFITEEQDRHSLDLAKALTQSGQSVPEPLSKLVESFKEKVKAGKEKAAGSGFGGRGLDRLDQDRDAARNAQRKAYKTGEGDEEEKEEDAGMGNKSDDLIAKAASAVQAAGTQVQQPPKPIAGVPAHIDLDGKITVHKTETPAPAAAGKLSDDPMERVRQVVGRLNSKVGGGVSSGAPLDNKGPDAGAFHATLEINDFPQKARWAVTNRTNVAKILEATGTSITTKGNFYPAGKVPEPGEAPKLYILVEGDTEIVVTTAMRELMRLLKDGAIAAAEGESRGTTGRYSVV